jgi:tetratricopeptide (TPR) repeat protein
MAKFCSKCGISLNDDEKFCGTCGYKQGKDAPRPDAAKNISTPKLKVIKTPFLLGGSAASAIVLAAVLVFTNVFGSFGNVAGGLFSGGKDNGGGNRINREVKAYPGVKINPKFNIIAERIMQINAGNLAVEPEIMSYTEEEIEEMVAMYLDMDIDELINSMKASRSKKELKDIREGCEEYKKKAQNGTLADELRKGIVMPGGSNLMQYPMNGLLPSKMMDGYKPNDEKATGEWALAIAEDMSTAMTFGCVTPGLIYAGGLAASVYPHPLVLNNYASLLRDDSPIDALFFYFAALECEPQNPIILTNIAMTYIELENYTKAKEYAEYALLHNPDNGQAYQILTLCHLKDGNSVLAAETLFKSTRDCFDDMTIALFDSYFEAIDNLKLDDEFPINDLVFELLYETARKNVDTAAMNDQLDTPNAQLTIKPYPYFGGTEDWMLSAVKYAEGLRDDNNAESSKAGIKASELHKKIFERQGEPETLEVVNNTRQYYAFLVLRSYYEFIIRKETYKMNGVPSLPGNFTEIIGDKLANFERINKSFVEAWEKEVKAASPVNEERVNLRNKLAFYRMQVGQIDDCYSMIKQFADVYWKQSRDVYAEAKQIIEEFWLSAGGIMKYMTDVNMIDLCEQYRNIFVYDHLGIGVGYVSNAGFSFDYEYQPLPEFALGSDEMSVKYIIETRTELMENIDTLSRYFDKTNELKQNKMPETVNFDGSPIDIEANAIPLYKDPNAEPSYSYTFAGYGVSHSDNETTWNLPFIGKSSYEYTTGNKTVYKEMDSFNPVTSDFKPAQWGTNAMNVAASTYDVAAKVVDSNELAGKIGDFASKMINNTHDDNDMLKDGLYKVPDVVKDAFSAITKVGDIIGFLQAGIDSKTGGTVKQYTYITRDSQGRVLDHGRVYERQVGGTLGISPPPGADDAIGGAGYSKERTITVTQSKITGATTKSNRLSVGFKFGPAVVSEIQ